MKIKNIILTAVLMLVSLGAVAQQTFNQPVVAVKGEAERSVTPDRFTINITLRENETKTDRLSIADKHKKLVAALRAVNIDPSALKTDDLGNSRYKRKDTRTTITYQLKLEDFEAVTRAFDAFAAAGVRQAYLAESTYSRQKEVEQELLAEAVRAAVGVKVEIVEQDEREAGNRRLLNLGHTLAHAIEKCSREMNHGEAVAVGTALVADAAVRMGVLSDADRNRIRALLMRLGMTLESPLPIAKLLREVGKDKKRVGAHLHLVVPTAIGRCEVRLVTEEEVQAIFAE